MFTLTNEAEFIRGLDQFEKQLEKSVEDFYRGWTVKMFQEIVWTTPQWSGNAVANWNYSVGEVDTAHSTQRLEDYASAKEQGQYLPQLQMGDSEAVREAFTSNEGREAGVRFTSGLLPTVFINNPSRGLNGKAYASYLEENKSGFLRVENEPGHMVARTAYKFGNMGRVDTQTLHKFSRARI